MKLTGGPIGNQMVVPGGLGGYIDQNMVRYGCASLIADSINSSTMHVLADQSVGDVAKQWAMPRHITHLLHREALQFSVQQR